MMMVRGYHNFLWNKWKLIMGLIDMTSLFLQLLLVIAIAMALTAIVLAVFGTKIKNSLSLSSSYNIAACDSYSSFYLP